MTDEEFEKLDAELREFLAGGRRGPIPKRLSVPLSSCRGCDRPDPEFYGVPRPLWLQANPTGRGCLCLDCLSKRLGRQLTAADFGNMPTTDDGDVELPYPPTWPAAK